jgi:hypothetical protein
MVGKFIGSDKGAKKTWLLKADRIFMGIKYWIEKVLIIKLSAPIGYKSHEKEKRHT